eukprot:6799021-Pyramimonas_sp.AAC.1
MAASTRASRWMPGCRHWKQRAGSCVRMVMPCVCGASFVTNRRSSGRSAFSFSCSSQAQQTTRTPTASQTGPPRAATPRKRG